MNATEKTIVIIPTYNEKENIEKMIEKVFSLSYPFHLLIIDDGSPDGTASIVKKIQEKYIDKLFLIERTGKLGLGTAYITGFRWALEQNYDYIMEMDCDFSHNPDDLIRLLDACRIDGADMSIGSRYVKGGDIKNWPFSRKLISYGGSVYVRLITWIGIKDSTAGFVCYKRKVIDSIDFNKIGYVGYGFQIEVKFAAYKLGFKLKEVPILFVDRIEGVSKMSKGIIKEAIVGVVAMQWNSFFNDYKKRP
ncbi:MAG: polyprenol monophosphomannose synthase [Bacteroidota bacterium]